MQVQKAAVFICVSMSAIYSLVIEQNITQEKSTNNFSADLRIKETQVSCFLLIVGLSSKILYFTAGK